MANFEGLIRGALAVKGTASPGVRAVVYQSSRNALKRLVQQNRSLTVESVVKQQQSLEEAIERIEAEYLAIENPPPPPPPAPEPTPAEKDPFYEIQQVLGTEPRQADPLQSQPASETPAPEISQAQQEPEVSDQTQRVAPAAPTEEVTVQAEPAPQPVNEPYPDEPTIVPPGFAKRRKSQRALFWFVFFLVVFGVLAWIGYKIFLGVVDGSLFGYNSKNTAVISQENTAADQSSDYITVVEPADLTAMVVSDRGRVEIINEQSLEMIRLFSVRDDVDRNQPAKPILFRLKPGVIEQIRGKQVTAEIFARSGGSGPAQYAVECTFSEEAGCGRKRFRVGVQPEASVFAFTISENSNINQDAFIALNTDITDTANVTGEGDVLDIVYLRLRTSKE